ncbi:hypothetical protein [Pleionea sp. CnH1-48]|uniref:hypothetical protein n=1 Tax=Pleionea sp. CnH1-48 TaxID=2954494 RepID=UPI0020975F6A|nr:hypothetical protein [Pleionea sp. CnH1-48]MCO7227555.1 hypothetical protein [Pleionea sp. CnH1-48]
MSNWKRVDELFGQYFLLAKKHKWYNEVVLLALAKNVVSKNKDESYYWLGRLKSKRMLGSILGLTVGCAYQDNDIIQDYRNKLKTLGADTISKIVQLILNFNYDEAFEKALIRTITSCPRD